MIYLSSLTPPRQAVHRRCRRKLAPVGGEGVVQPGGDSGTIFLHWVLERCTGPATAEIVIEGHVLEQSRSPTFLEYLNRRSSSLANTAATSALFAPGLSAVYKLVRAMLFACADVPTTSLGRRPNRRCYSPPPSPLSAPSLPTSVRRFVSLPEPANLRVRLPILQASFLAVPPPLGYRVRVGCPSPEPTH